MPDANYIGGPVRLVARFGVHIYIDVSLEWHEHINYIKNKLNSSMYALRYLTNILNNSHLHILYYSLVYPYLDYGLALWGSTHSTIVNRVFVTDIRFG